MRSRFARYLPLAAMLAVSLAALWILRFRPGYLNSAEFMGGLIFLQILLAAVWNYEQRFFPLLVVVFLWAGIQLPLSGVWTAGRWPVLAVGAMVGFALYMRTSHHRFGVFHLVALFCVVSAMVSASVSALPVVSSLKALSLLLLFLYASTGARLALAQDEVKFFRYLLRFVEIVVWVSALAYLILRFPLFGNPNSMGAVMGVIAVPLLFWRLLAGAAAQERRRLILVFAVGMILLFFSQARAGILAAGVSCGSVCIVLRRYRLLLRGAAACIGVAVLAFFLTPNDVVEDMPSLRGESSITSVFLYKGKESAGVLGSRNSLWDETASVIRENPWFGSGFGTSPSDRADDIEFGRFSSNSSTTREHGDSYLATMEGVGLLGVVPFFFLVAYLATKLGSIMAWLRRTGNVRHPAIPLAMVLASGLVHAAFEDWLFAVGYYLCVFFWVLAFSFMDILPPNLPALYRRAPKYAFRTLPGGVPVAWQR